MPRWARGTHGAAHNFKFMEDHKFNADAWKWKEDYLMEAEKQLAEQFDMKPVIKDMLDYRIVLDKESIREQGLDEERVRQIIVDMVLKMPHVSFAFDFKNAATAPVPEFLRERALNGYHHDRSGDIIFMLEPGFYSFGKGSSPIGTTHGTWWAALRAKSTSPTSRRRCVRNCISSSRMPASESPLRR